MVSWILIIILVLIGLFFIKISYFKHKFFVILLILLALFLYLTINYINRENNLDFSTMEGFVRSVKIYKGWLANGFQNIRVLVGNAVNMDWKSTNGTFSFKNNTKNTSIINKNNKESVTFAK